MTDPAKQSWADEVDSSKAGADGKVFAPPGLDPPPGFEDVAPGTFQNGNDDVDSIATGLSSVQVAPDGVVDAPEPTIRPAQLQDPDEIKTETVGDTLYKSAKSFEELGLSPELLQGLYMEMKFEKPSRIQATTLPMILTPPYRNMIAQAHNGSGKTVCFVLAMLSRVEESVRQPQALCVCPTRELAAQNLAVCERIGKYTSISAMSTSQDSIESSRRSRIEDQVIFGTHGKLKSWISKRMLSTRTIKILVFDEADDMLKADGFADDSTRMIKDLRRANPQIQLLLFSATYNDKVKNFAKRIVGDANQVFVPKEQLSLDVIKQYLVVCPSVTAKVEVLKNMIFPQCEKLGQTIIFVRTRETARRLHSEMEKEGHKCTSIEGGMEKSARDRVVQEFRDGTTKILISTDVLSRGFDVSQVTLVINYDVPTERDGRTPNYETYLHRIGRSGRFGRKGAAFMLVYGQQEKMMAQSIQDYFQHSITEVPYNDEDHFVEVLKEAGLTEG